MSKPEVFSEKIAKISKDSLYICAAGFEERVKGIIQELTNFNQKFFKYSTIMKYKEYSNQKDHKNILFEFPKPSFYEKNNENLKFLARTLPTISLNLTNNILVDIDNMHLTKSSLEKTLSKIKKGEIDSVFIDISGMANFLILLTLSQVRKIFPNIPVNIVYSEAQEYFPQKHEISEILRIANSRVEDDILKMGELLGASGARETFILPDYKGYFRDDYPICLIFFVGYEPSRAIGLLEGYRPNRVIACYGVSPHKKFLWRTEFSKHLHESLNVFKQYDKTTIKISTFNISEILKKLEEIYASEDADGKILYDNYNIAITPQCSKLQTVAVYLFCQSHPDIQVVFCLPGLFNPDRYSKGIGYKWIYQLPC
jgi:hypothetical protein